MQKTLKRALVLVIGWAFILLGVVGLFLPILQGILFLLIGLFILSSEYVWAHRVLHKIKSRFPRIAAQFDAAKAAAERQLERWFGKHKAEAKVPVTVEQADSADPHK